MKFHFSLKDLLASVLLILMTAGLIVPSFAQDSAIEISPDNLTIVTGAVHFTEDGDIMVADVALAPAGVFNPSQLEEGDLVIIMGVMLNETTLQAVSFEFFDDAAEPEVTPELPVEATAEPTEEPACDRADHPLATRIAETFSVSYDEVMTLHCAGNGFGNIIRAYALAELSEDDSTAQDFIDRHHHGEGWGQIMRDSDVHPSELAPGKVLKNHSSEESEDSTAASGNSKGRGNGNGGGNGNGNGNGHGNGNGKNN
jgi:hypothetical protein